MSHLMVELYERVDDRFPSCTLADHDLHRRQCFYDLHPRGVADRAARVVVRPGDEYRTGDHIRLLDKARPGHADTIAIDPAIAADVDLNEVLFNKDGFAERAKAVLLITNPDVGGNYRLRVSLYAQVGQKIPSLLLYDWECPKRGLLADLEWFHFAHRVAFIRVEKGPAYQAGDRIILREAPATGCRSYMLEPGDYDLTRFMVEESREVRRSIIRERKSWAENLAALELNLQPQIIRN